MFTTSTEKCSDDCGFCRDTLAEGNVVIHPGVHGPKHPFHAECVREWMLATGSNYLPCPLCQEPLDGTALSSLKDRVIIELTNIKADLVLGLQAGALMGWFDTYRTDSTVRSFVNNNELSHLETILLPTAIGGVANVLKGFVERRMGQEIGMDFFQGLLA